MIHRMLRPEIQKRLFQGKNILLSGPRGVGKTSLIKSIIEEWRRPFIHLNGDDPHLVQKLLKVDETILKGLIEEKPLVLFSSAQRFTNIEEIANIITKHLADKQFAICSSHESTKGKLESAGLEIIWQFKLWPISWEEWQDYHGYKKADQSIDSLLSFGFYPANNAEQEKRENCLKENLYTALEKDLPAATGIKKPKTLLKLLQLLSHQLGEEVNYKKLGIALEVDPKTVSKYINILEKAYIVFQIQSYNNKLKNEIKTSRKVYFYDNGVRNSLINAWYPVVGRLEIDKLWENFMISERIKQLSYRNIDTKKYFWRTKQQQLISYIEERDSKLLGFNFKLNPKQNIHFSKTFSNNYNAQLKGINRSNFRGFVILHE